MGRVLSRRELLRRGAAALAAPLGASLPPPPDRTYVAAVIGNTRRGGYGHGLDMRFFAGEPLWCSARVTEKGRDVTAEDRRAATEPLGPVAGDSVHATYAFPGGVHGHFASQKAQPGGRFQIELYGSKGAAVVHIGMDPQVFVLSDPLWSPGKTGSRWQPLPDAPSNADPSGLRDQAAANKRIVEGLLRAIETGIPCAESGQEGRAVLEMILAVYAARLGGGRVTFPLRDRRHPLGTLK